MISSLFRKNRATGTNITMHAPKPSPTITPQPLGLKTFAPGVSVDGGLDCLRRPHRVDRSRVTSTVNPLAACEEEEEKEEEADADAREAAAAVVEEGEPEIPEEVDNACWASYGRGRYHKFPPPMPLLARTAKLSCRMPWVLARSRRADGSLVIREVRVRRHEYFRVRRGDGRLTLELVELDENSPLFGGAGKEHETTASVLHPQYSCEVNQCDGSTVANTTSEEGADSNTTSPRFPAASALTTEPSSPLREPTLAIRTRSGCVAAGCPMSPLHSPMSRMRAVHV